VKLLASQPSGERVEVTVGIGRPYPLGPDEWACSVILTGLHADLHDAHGARSLQQSLCLAASLLRQVLTYFVEDGGRLTHVDGTSFDIAASFSGTGATGESA
jgi:hypothetical protein